MEEDDDEEVNFSSIRVHAAAPALRIRDAQQLQHQRHDEFTNSNQDMDPGTSAYKRMYNELISSNAALRELGSKRRYLFGPHCSIGGNSANHAMTHVQLLVQLWERPAFLVLCNKITVQSV